MSRAHPRRRAALVLAAAASLSGLAGCGGGDEAEAPPPAPAPAPVVNLPAPVTSVNVGDVVTAGDGTPKDVARALRSRRVVVVAFVLPGAVDDRQVASALRTVQGDAASEGVRFFVYRVGQDRRFGDLADLLGVAGTPAVAVLGRDARLLKLFPGLVDAPILREAVRAARERDPVADAGGEPADDAGGRSAGTGSGASTTPLARARRGARGSAAGIALAREVNRSYAAVPGIGATASSTLDVIGPVDITLTAALDGGRITGTTATYAADRFALQLTTAGKAALMRVDGGCWAAPPGEDLGDGLGVGEPVIPIAGSSFGVPRRRGDRTVLAVRERGDAAAHKYTIATATSRIASATYPDLGTVRFSTLAAAPDIPVAEPRCSSPDELASDLRRAVAGG